MMRAAAYLVKLPSLAALTRGKILAPIETDPRSNRAIRALSRAIGSYPALALKTT
jgi:hypothetical protein